MDTGKQASQNRSGKPPEVKRLRTKLSTVRECLTGISNLIQNVPREAIDATNTFNEVDITLFGNAGSKSNVTPVRDQRQSSEFLLPSSRSHTGGGLGLTSSQSRYLPKLPSSIQIEIISKDTPSSFGSGQGSHQYSSYRSTEPSTSRLSNITNYTGGTHLFATPAAIKPARSETQSQHGSSTNLLASGSFPRHFQSTPIKPGQPRPSTVTSAGQSVLDQRIVTAGHTRHSSTTSSKSHVTAGSSGVEISLYPSGNLDENVLSQSLKEFMSDDDGSDTGENDTEGYSNSVEFSRGASERESDGALGEPMTPPVILPTATGAKRKSQFQPAANSTLIGQSRKGHRHDSATGKSSLDKSSLDVHQGPTNDQRTVGTQTSGPKLGTGTKLKCDRCRREFGTFHERATHLETDHGHDSGVSGLECNICLAKFRNATNLKKHQYIRHKNNGNPYVCSVCQEQFQDYVAYEAHRRTHSNRYSQVTCPKCQYQFNPSAPGAVLESLTCVECKFQTNYSASLLRHTKSVKHLRTVKFVAMKERKQEAARQAAQLGAGQLTRPAGGQPTQHVGRHLTQPAAGQRTQPAAVQPAQAVGVGAPRTQAVTRQPTQAAAGPPIQPATAQPTQHVGRHLTQAAAGQRTQPVAVQPAQPVGGQLTQAATGQLTQAAAGPPIQPSTGQPTEANVANMKVRKPGQEPSGESEAGSEVTPEFDDLEGEVDSGDVDSVDMSPNEDHSGDLSSMDTTDVTAFGDSILNLTSVEALVKKEEEGEEDGFMENLEVERNLSGDE